LGLQSAKGCIIVSCANSAKGMQSLLVSHASFEHNTQTRSNNMVAFAFSVQIEQVDDSLTGQASE
jgi:hypothetical protein